MKRVVVATGLHEADIRPNVLLSEFKRLSVIDASNYFKDRSQFIEIDCPACDSPDKTPAFRKDSFLYNRCCECGSVFVSPRPSAAQLVDYYTNSAASNFRVTHFAKDTAQARREHLLRSLSNWLGRIVDETGNSEARDYVDMNTHLPAIFKRSGGWGCSIRCTASSRWTRSRTSAQRWGSR